MKSKSAFAAVKPDMEIITADGKRAGFVVDVVWGEIIVRAPPRRIPLGWLRRVNKDGVHIAPNLRDLDRAHAPARRRSGGLNEQVRPTGSSGVRGVAGTTHGDFPAI
jgi:hypothetical protein